MKPFLYVEFPPARDLAQHVLTYWWFEARLPDGERFLHHIWPDGCVSIGVASRAGRALDASVVGPVVEALREYVEGGIRYCGARLWPDAGAAVVGAPAESLRARTVPAADLFGEQAAELAESVAAAPDRPAVAAAFDAWLHDLVRAAPALDDRVRAAVRAIIDGCGETPVSALAAGASLSTRQLQRRFRRAVGLTPKEYSRIRRLRSTISDALGGEVSWSSLAAGRGFADQSHLIHELAELTGFTPAALKERLGIIEHGDVVP